MIMSLTKLEDMSPLEIFNMFKLRVDVFIVEQNCAYPEIDDVDKNCVHLQIKDGEHLAAYCRIINEGDTARIGRVIVHPSYRSQQLGRKLMNVAIKEIKLVDQYKWIELSAQSHLQNFYSSFGFSAISDEYVEDNIPHIDMKMAKEK